MVVLSGSALSLVTSPNRVVAPRRGDRRGEVDPTQDTLQLN